MVISEGPVVDLEEEGGVVEGEGAPARVRDLPKVPPTLTLRWRLVFSYRFPLHNFLPCHCSRITLPVTPPQQQLLLLEDLT